MLASCGSHRQAAVTAESVQPDYPLSGFIPRARIYRTSAPSDSLVPITLRGNTVTSFPAPADLTALPERLADGWLLDHRGITPATVFTRYTYDEYRSLQEAPTTAELLRAVDPDVVVTDIVDLPYPYSDITAEKADSLINAGLPGCKTILER